MPNKKTIIIREQRNKDYAISLIRQLPFDPIYKNTIEEYTDSRTLEQNAKMWACLTDISKQVEWYGRYLTKTVWKEIITASLKGQETVPGLDGNFVVIGASTSKMSIKEMCDVITCALAFGDSKGVKFKDPKEKYYTQRGE